MFSFLDTTILSTAVLIDGAYFIKRFRSIDPSNSYNPQRAADMAFEWACAHLSQDPSKFLDKSFLTSSANQMKFQSKLYRIFFYDCPPLEKRLHNPVSGRCVDFSKSDEAVFRRKLHELLGRKRKVILRLGHLSKDVQWTIRPEKIAKIMKNQASIVQLEECDVLPKLRQKGVDMRIGVDLTSIVFKKLVDQIVLVAGDADFVPAGKQARREGIDFILDPMWRSVPEQLIEHVDGVRSTCPKPSGTRL